MYEMLSLFWATLYIVRQCLWLSRSASVVCPQHGFCRNNVRATLQLGRSVASHVAYRFVCLPVCLSCLSVCTYPSVRLSHTSALGPLCQKDALTSLKNPASSRLCAAVVFTFFSSLGYYSVCHCFYELLCMQYYAN